MPLFRQFSSTSLRSFRPLLAMVGVLALSGGVIGCAAEEEDPAVRVRLANLGKGKAQDDSNEEGSLSGGITVVDSQGDPIEVDSADFRFETRGSGSWEDAQELQVPAGLRPRVDVVLVADVSGSLAEEMDDIRNSLSDFARVLMAPARDDRVGLVRVSTAATISQSLTSDQDAVQAAIDGLESKKGWTALWDGLRIANQMLDEGGAQVEGTCVFDSSPNIVVFADGQENNSTGQKTTKYPGDGIDTYLEDVLDLHARGRRTTVHTVGVGDDIDEVALGELADGSGGLYRSIGSTNQLIGALRKTADQLKSARPVCFRPAHCSHTEVKVTVAVEREKKKEIASYVAPISSSCSTQE